MRTALDTNVFSALWSKESISTRVAEKLVESKSSGAVIVSAAVYAELLAHPTFPEASINAFLSETGIAVDFSFSTVVWLEAGRRYARYAARRRRASAQEPKRMLADFMIGAHAVSEADRFMTLDPDRYRRDFPELRLVHP